MYQHMFDIGRNLESSMTVRVDVQVLLWNVLLAWLCHVVP